MNKNITVVLTEVKNHGSLINLNYGYTVTKMRYGERLKKARKHADLTQAGLMTEMGKLGRSYTQENISKLERGKAEGSEFTALFAQVCGVDYIWLATGQGEMIPNKDTSVKEERLAYDSQINALDEDLKVQVLKMLEAAKTAMRLRRDLKGRLRQPRMRKKKSL